MRQWIAYLPRFMRHYRHRRKAGYTISHAIGSTRLRMRAYTVQRPAAQSNDRVRELSNT